jgi:hypothetical protein
MSRRDRVAPRAAPDAEPRAAARDPAAGATDVVAARPSAHALENRRLSRRPARLVDAPF